MTRSLTTQEHADLRRKIDDFSSWMGKRLSVHVSEIPCMLRVKNEDRSAVEVWEWLHLDPPSNYFCYLSEKDRTITTFMGDILGTVAIGETWRDNFGSTRVSIKVKATNGSLYSGTYYKSAGSYCGIRLVKGKN